MVRLLLAAFLLVQPPSPAGQTTCLFSYFTGNGEDGLHFAASRDGLTWTALNEGRASARRRGGAS